MTGKGHASESHGLTERDRQVAAQNRERWNALSKSGVEYGQPFLELDPARARRFLDPQGLMDPLVDRRVLLLAGGGGQQSACLALLGARVTVLELSDEQLERDREAARVHGYDLELHQGDMRDLSRFARDAFDLVYHPYSVNFVPDVQPVFREVTRVLVPGGQYVVEWHNPFTQLADHDQYDETVGFGLHHPYRDGEIDLKAIFDTNQWPVKQEDGSVVTVEHPRSWVHTMSTVLGGLVHNGLVVLGMDETLSDEDAPTPGGWEHFKQVTVPYLRLWTRLIPEAFQEGR